MTPEERLAVALDKVFGDAPVVAGDGLLTRFELARALIAADPDLVCAHDPATVAAGEALERLPKDQWWVIEHEPGARSPDRRWSVVGVRTIDGHAETFPEAVAAALAEGGSDE